MSVKIKQDINIGCNIRDLRRKADLTQEQVVTRLNERGIPSNRSIYSQMECGLYSIRVSELIALAEIFDVDYNAFFKGVDLKHKKLVANNLCE